MTYIWINPVTDRMYDSEGLNHFLKRLGVKFPGELLKNSPIPPGFFGKPQETDVVTGVKEVESYLKEKRWNKVKMVELLYCRGGCHVGDGVTGL